MFNPAMQDDCSKAEAEHEQCALNSLLECTAGIEGNIKDTTLKASNASSAKDEEEPTLPSNTPKHSHTGIHQATHSRHPQMSSFEQRLLKSVEAQETAAVFKLTPVLQELEDEDSLFTRGLVPVLKRLNLQKKAEVKLKIHQLLYDAEFN